MVIINIHCSNTVTPSETTPTSTHYLSLCDQIKLPNHGSQLYLYSNSNSNNHDHTINIIRTSLAKTLTHYYPFAGRLTSTDGGRFKLLCNAKGANLLEATCEVSFANSNIFDSFDVVEKLVPYIKYDDVPIEDVPLILIQLTRFSCGTLTLGVSLCRALLDGSSAANFMCSWAKLARGESLDSSLIPFHNRTLLDSLNTPPSFHFQHPEFSPPPLWEKLAHVTQKQQLVYATAIFKLTKNQVEKLKIKANKKDMVRGYTSFEVISGHLWRCVCKVRRYNLGNGNQPTRLTTLVNCRNRLKPPLPKTYFGNATFPTVTPTCSFDDVIDKPFGYVVGKVREAIERMNDEYVRSALNYVANQKDLNLLRDTFYNFARRNGQLGGNPNLYVVGWTNFPYYETDFGWGKPYCMLPGNINSDGKTFIIDNGSGGDGFLVAICLLHWHIDALKRLFYEDIEPATSKL